MRPFQFSLARVLDWRQSGVAVAENQLAQLERQRDQARQAVANLDGEVARATEPLREGASITGAELEALAEFQSAKHAERWKLVDVYAGFERKVQQQRAAVIKQRRDCRLLETLRQKQLTRWQVDYNRHQEHVAADTHQALRHLSNDAA